MGESGLTLSLFTLFVFLLLLVIKSFGVELFNRESGVEERIYLNFISLFAFVKINYYYYLSIVNICDYDCACIVIGWTNSVGNMQ